MSMFDPVWMASLSPATQASYRIFAGNHLLSFHSDDMGVTWTQDPTYAWGYMRMSKNVVFRWRSNGTFQRSTDGGFTWQDRTSLGGSPSPYSRQLGHANGVLFYADGGSTLRYSTDQGNTWNSATLPNNLAGGYLVSYFGGYYVAPYGNERMSFRSSNLSSWDFVYVMDVWNAGVPDYMRTGYVTTAAALMAPERGTANIARSIDLSNSYSDSSTTVGSSNFEHYASDGNEAFFYPNNTVANAQVTSNGVDFMGYANPMPIYSPKFIVWNGDYFLMAGGDGRVYYTKHPKTNAWVASNATGIAGGAATLA